MKYIFTLFFSLILLFPASSYAIVTPPQEGIWVTPSDAKPDEKITVNAFVYNIEKREVTVTVLFTEKKDQEVVHDIGTISLTLPSETAKIAMVSYIMPSRETVVTATVIKALTRDKQAIPALEGVLGTTTIGPKEKVPLPFNIDTGNIQGFFGTLLARIERFRTARATVFVQKRDTLRSALGTNKTADFLDRIDDQGANDTVKEGQVAIKSDIKESVNIIKYSELILYTALASLFTNTTIFYITAILLALLVLKFIFGRFI